MRYEKQPNPQIEATAKVLRNDIDGELHGILVNVRPSAELQAAAKVLQYHGDEASIRVFLAADGWPIGFDFTKDEGNVFYKFIKESEARELEAKNRATANEIGAKG